VNAVLTHSARLFAVVLTFVCIGSLVQLALEAVLLIFCMLLSGTAGIGAVALQLMWTMSMVYPAMAGLTGVIVGVCEIKFDRGSAWVMLAISLLVALPGLVQSAMTLNYLFHREAGVAWSFFGADGIMRVSFLASMMACWKMNEMERGRASVARGLPSP
jgi:hypothetical protein